MRTQAPRKQSHHSTDECLGPGEGLLWDEISTAAPQPTRSLFSSPHLRCSAGLLGADRCFSLEKYERFFGEIYRPSTPPPLWEGLITKQIYRVLRPTVTEPSWGWWSAATLAQENITRCWTSWNVLYRQARKKKRHRKGKKIRERQDCNKHFEGPCRKRRTRAMCESAKLI